MNYFYKAHLVKTLNQQVPQVKGVKLLRKLEDYDSVNVSNNYLKIKSDICYSVFSANSSELFTLPKGVKPLLISSSLLVFKFENQIGLMNYKTGKQLGQTISLNFSPKNMVNLDKNNLMLVGNKSAIEFAVINIKDNVIQLQTPQPISLLFSNDMPQTLKKVFQDLPLKFISIKFIEVLEQDDENQKLVIMCSYNRQTDQYIFHTLILEQKPGPKWEFKLTDTYKMRPGKLVNGFTLSHYQEDKNIARIIVVYDCSKLVEIMVNINSNQAQERFQRYVTKLKHSINFGEIKNAVKIEGTSEMMVQDGQFLSIFRPDRYIAKNSKMQRLNQEKVVYTKENRTQNMLLFPQNQGIIVPLNDSILIFSAQSFQIFDLIRISIPETIDFYLEHHDLHTALKIMNKFKIESNQIVEYQLKICQYSNIDMLTKYLEKARFQDISYILLKQKVSSFQALKMMVQRAREMLNAKEMGCLRQIMWYNQRLSLFQRLKLKEDPQSFMVKDFISMCNQIFYHTDLNDSSVEHILELNFCEIALNYHSFMQILPYQKLSADLISKILPSKSELWGKLKKLGVSVTSADLYIMVASELSGFKSYSILKRGIELENICNHEMCKLAIQSIELPHQVDVYTDDIELISFKDEFENIDEMLEIMGSYFAKAKFVFHRDRECYKKYLKQVRYFIFVILEPYLRQEFLLAVVSAQAQRQYQFTINDSDLVQIVLDLIYQPIFNPKDKQIKFMNFSKEMVNFLNDDIMSNIQTTQNQEGELLELTPNQMQFINDNLSKHIKLGTLQVTQTWLDYSDSKSSNVLDFDAKNLRFVDFLTLDKEKALLWLTSIIDLNIKLSLRKREKIFNLTKQTTNLFYGNLFSKDDKSSEGDKKWKHLYEQLCHLNNLLGQDINISKIFIDKMLQEGIYDALKQLMSLGLSNEVRICVLSDIQSKYDQLIFQKPLDENDDSNLQKFRIFKQKSKEFLKMMKSEQVEQECNLERDLLELTEQLITHEYVVYYIPTGQIREDFKNNQVLRRIYQIHGLEEVLSSGIDLSIFVSSNLAGEPHLTVLFETLLFMNEVSMLSKYELVKESINYMMASKKVKFEGKYQEVQNILYQIVQMQAAPSAEGYNLATFLLKTLDQEQISQEKFHNLCVIFNRKNVTQKFDVSNLKNALQMRQKQRALALFRGKTLEDLKDFDLSYKEVKYLLKITDQTVPNLKKYKNSNNVIQIILNPEQFKQNEEEQTEVLIENEDIQQKIKESYGEITPLTVAKFLDESKSVSLEHSLSLLGDASFCTELKHLHDMCNICYLPLISYLFKSPVDVDCPVAFLKHVLSETDMESYELLLLLELFNKLDESSFYQVVYLMEFNSSMVSLCCLAMYLKNQYANIRYGKQPVIDNETLIAFGIDQEQTKNINQILVDELDVQPNLLL